MKRNSLRLVGLTSIIVLCAATSIAALAQTPQAWMEHLYGQFRNHHEPEYHGKAANLVFDVELANLEHKHQAQTDTGQDDFDDGNDLCGGCQDTDHPAWKITTDQQGPNKATSVVLFTDQGRTLTYRFSLRLTPGGWRISDFQTIRDSAVRKVPSSGMPSFKAQLVARIRQASTQKKGSQS